jgi:hypothetical protein
MVSRDSSLAILKEKFRLVEPIPVREVVKSLAKDDVAKLLDPYYKDLEHGYISNPDGTWYVACSTPLGECTGEHFDFWFCHCHDTERYQWWHPVDHKTGTWDDDYFKIPPESRERGHYINHTHKVCEDIGGEAQHLHIQFVSPASFGFGDDCEALFEAANVTACVCGIVHVYDFPFGYLAVGSLLHMVATLADGSSELRSRFWIGTVDAGSGLGPSIINTVGNTRWFRTIKVPEKKARDLFVHCSEEMWVRIALYYCSSFFLFLLR